MSVAEVTSLVAVRRSWLTVSVHSPRDGEVQVDSGIGGGQLAWRSGLKLAVPFWWVTSRVCCGLEGDSRALMPTWTAARKMTRPSLVTGLGCALEFEMGAAGCACLSREE